MKTQFVFDSSLLEEIETMDGTEEREIPEDQLVRLFPYGVSLAADASRPILLFKTLTGETLPVPVNHLEAGVTISQSNKTSVPVTPHKVTELLLSSLGVRLERCLFVEIKGQHQFVRLFVSGHPSLKSLKVRADEAMSLCLHLNTPIFATKSLMNKSRVMSMDLHPGDQGLFQNAADLLQRDHSYIM